MSSRTKTPTTSFDDTWYCTDCGRRLKYEEYDTPVFDATTGKMTNTVTRWKVCPKKYRGDWRLWKGVYHDSWKQVPNSILFGDKYYDTP